MYWDFVWVVCEIGNEEYSFTYEYELMFEDFIEELIEEEIETRYRDIILENGREYSYHTVEY